MAATRSPASAVLAAEAWRALLDYFFENRDRHVALAAEFGLTVGDMKTLLSLRSDEPCSMRSLAAEWKCDASNVTWLVDRLEERGLVERRTSPLDRRVKTVVLTTAGVTMKEAVLERMYEPPEAMLALPREDLQALARALGKLRAD
ncbi:MAG: MarR family winged helix-turn-helix transcriptional regulator [Acidimicrobiales bacterium]